MTTNIKPTNPAIHHHITASWWTTFQRRGYFANYVAIATIICGIYLHVTRFFLGDALLIQYVFTAAYDMVLTIPMAYAGIFGVLNWRRVLFHNTGHKIAYGLAIFYIAGSIPLHVQAFFTHWTGYISWFPMWFSIVLMPVYVGIIVLMWRLRYRQ